MIYEKYILCLSPDIYKRVYNVGNYYNEFRSTFIICVYATLIKFSVQWYKDQKRKSELIMEKQASELALLKSQINPHFLFNTLNNIYSLVYQKSDSAPSALIKLSEIMRYTLYEVNVEKVTLKDEISYLKNYIELQSLRFKEKDVIRADISDNCNGFYVSPMLFIPFIENAFKHSEKGKKNPAISLKLFCEDNFIYFAIDNFIKSKENLILDRNGGIGLVNVKRRLELIYGDNYKLEIKKTEEKYLVELKIKNI